MSTTLSKLAVILLGKPGSGKGTQAALLAEKFGFFHFEMSDLLQEIFKKNPNDPAVQREKKKFDAAKLVSASFVAKLDIELIKKTRQRQKGIIFDGPFRLLSEAKKVFPVLLGEYGLANIKVLYVKISSRESIWRNARRKICQRCDSPIPWTYQTKNLKICPRKDCQGKLMTRKDDNSATIKRRLKIFNKETQPVIDYFKKQGVLIEINGQQSINNVFKDMVKKIKS